MDSVEGSTIIVPDDYSRGFYSESYSKYNLFANNTTIESYTDGIYIVTNSNGNDIVKNVIYNTEEGYGLRTYKCEYNYIYNNDLINNHNDVFDDGDNYYDYFYPTCGNYWSNYLGINEMLGYEQSQAGSDGIVDTPYNISGGDNVDHYPYMEPLIGISNTKTTALFKVEPTVGNLSTDFIFDVSGSSDNEYDCIHYMVKLLNLYLKKEGLTKSI